MQHKAERTLRPGKHAISTRELATELRRYDRNFEFSSHHPTTAGRYLIRSERVDLTVTGEHPRDTAIEFLDRLRDLQGGPSGPIDQRIFHGCRHAKEELRAAVLFPGAHKRHAAHH